MVEGLERCVAAPSLRVDPYGAGFPGALLIGTGALNEVDALGIVGGDASLSIGRIAPPCSEVTSGLAGSLVSMVLVAVSSSFVPADSLELASRGACRADTLACSGNVGGWASIALVTFRAGRAPLSVQW